MLFECSLSASPAAELWIELAVGWDFLTTSFIPVQSNTFPGGTVRTTVFPLSPKTLAPGAAAVTRYKQGNVYFLRTLTTCIAGSASSDKSISSDTSAALAAASSRSCAARSVRARASFAWMSPRQVGQDCCWTSHSRKQ